MMPVEPVKVGVGTPDEQAKRFLSKYAGSAAKAAGDGLRSLPTEPPDEQGLTSVRLNHVVPGTDLPVFDHVSTATFKASGELVIADADFAPGIDKVNRTPTLSKEDATQRANSVATERCES